MKLYMIEIIRTTRNYRTIAIFNAQNESASSNTYNRYGV